MFILGTSSVLALVPIDQIDLIAPIPQVLSIGLRAARLGGRVAPVTILVLLVSAWRRRASSSRATRGCRWSPGGTACCRTGSPDSTRDIGRPSNSIVFVGAVTFVFSLAGLVGVGKQEAFQLLWNASAIFYALTYLVMFAIPIVGLEGQPHRPPLWIRVAAGSGFLMTALYALLSVLPIVNVTSRTVFALKITAVIALSNAIGAAIYRNASRAANPARESLGP